MSPADIKSLMVEQGGTPTERCIALLIASGITATKDIAEALGVTLRAVQKAKQRTSVREPEFAGEPQDANHSSTPNHSSPKSEPQFVSQPSETRAHATKELPSEVVIPVVIDYPPSAPPALKKASPRGARLSADWTLPDDWRQWARINFAHASDAMVDTEADKFRDFWISKAGQAASKLDWAATWRNWCRTAFAAKPSAQPLNYGRASWEEQKAAKHEATRKMLRDLGYRSEAVQ